MSFLKVIDDLARDKPMRKTKERQIRKQKEEEKDGERKHLREQLDTLKSYIDEVMRKNQEKKAEEPVPKMASLADTLMAAAAAAGK